MKNRCKLCQTLKLDIDFLKSLHPEECKNRDKIIERLAEAERQAEKERLAEAERLAEVERLEKERLAEVERMEKERLEKERLEKERLEKERLAEVERLEKERMVCEATEALQAEKERLAEAEQLAKELSEKAEIQYVEPLPPVDNELCGIIEEYESEEVTESEVSLYQEIEEELKDVKPNQSTETKMLELCGNIEFSEILCDKCEKAKEDYIKKAHEEGLTEITANYFSMSCKPCQKARFNSWKAKKRATEQIKKANDKNSESKSLIKNTNKKLELKSKLEAIDEEYKEGKNDRVISKLEKIHNGQGKLNLNIFIKK